MSKKPKKQTEKKASSVNSDSDGFLKTIINKITEQFGGPAFVLTFDKDGNPVIGQLARSTLEDFALQKALENYINEREILQENEIILSISQGNDENTP